MKGNDTLVLVLLGAGAVLWYFSASRAAQSVAPTVAGNGWFPNGRIPLQANTQGSGANTIAARVGGFAIPGIPSWIPPSTTSGQWPPVVMGGPPTDLRNAIDVAGDPQTSPIIDPNSPGIVDTANGGPVYDTNGNFLFNL